MIIAGFCQTGMSPACLQSEQIIFQSAVLLHHVSDSEGAQPLTLYLILSPCDKFPSPCVYFFDLFSDILCLFSISLVVLYHFVVILNLLDVSSLF